MDCSTPGSSSHGIFQARTLKWVAISFCRGFSQPRDHTQVPCIADGRQILYRPSNQGSPAYFHVLTIVNNAATNVGVQYFFNIVISFPSNVYPEVGLLDHIVILFLIFEGLHTLHSICARLYPHKEYTRISFLQHFGISHLYDSSHSNRCEVISHCGFVLHFLMITDVNHLFV